MAKVAGVVASVSARPEVAGDTVSLELSLAAVGSFSFPLTVAVSVTAAANDAGAWPVIVIVVDAPDASTPPVQMTSLPATVQPGPVTFVIEGGTESLTMKPELADLLLFVTVIVQVTAAPAATAAGPVVATCRSTGAAGQSVASAFADAGTATCAARLKVGVPAGVAIATW